MLRAIVALDVRPDHLLIDAMALDIDIPQTSIIKGDAKSISIAALVCWPKNIEINI